jgi:hypothetical protein
MSDYSLQLACALRSFVAKNKKIQTSIILLSFGWLRFDETISYYLRAPFLFAKRETKRM